MSFRRRILLSSIILVWIPLLVVAGLTRREMGKQLSREHRERVDALASVSAGDVKALRESLHSRLAGFKAQIEGDNQFRLALAGEVDRTYLLDYAAGAMDLLALSALQIQDEQGRVLSSGHFRNEYDRVDPRFETLRACGDRLILLQVRKPEGSHLVMAVIDSLHLGQERLFLVGGVEAEERFLARLSRGQGQAVTLIFPGGTLSSSSTLQSYLAMSPLPVVGWESVFPRSQTIALREELPFVGEGAAPATAVLVVSHSLASLQKLLRDLNLWLGAVLLATILGTLLLSLWASARISRPLAELAALTSRVDLDRLDQDFPVGRRDEVGELSRFLQAMMSRLRTSVLHLRDAERKATMGLLARQINHDIRNGLTPIRNVLRHLGQVAAESPRDLPRVWSEREPALRSGMSYLEGLVGNYARFYQGESPRQPCDLGSVVREVVAVRREGSRAVLVTQLAPDLPPVLAVRLGLHRIVDNLVANAQESSARDDGRVVIETRLEAAGDGPCRVSLSVSDNGEGIAGAELPRIFSDFYTTKEQGTGLGLSIVRRLVADFDGTIRVESEVGRGTRFVVEFPAVADSADPVPDTALSVAKGAAP